MRQRPDPPAGVEDRRQRPVAHAVAKLVIDRLEIVEIDEDHGQAVLVPAGPVDGRVEPVREQEPVGQVRQRIMLRQMADALLGLTNRGDVVIDPSLGSSSTLIAAHSTRLSPDTANEMPSVRPTSVESSPADAAGALRKSMLK